MKTVKLSDLKNSNVSYFSKKDNSVRGCKTEYVENIKIGDEVVINNYFRLVVEE